MSEKKQTCLAEQKKNKQTNKQTNKLPSLSRGKRNFAVGDSEPCTDGKYHKKKAYAYGGVCIKSVKL